MDFTLQTNTPLKMDGLKLLDSLPEFSVDACIFDPQYRAGLDALAYGNEGKSRMKARSALTQMSNETIVNFISGSYLAMKESAYMFLWVDKFTIAEGIHLNWIDEAFGENKNRCLILVDMICWDKGSFGMGARSRRTNEFLLVYQKYPKTTKNWTDKGIKDTFLEKIPEPRNKTAHAHRKPLGLTARLITAAVPVGGIVLDPCAGSFSTLLACKMTGRNFIGCDLTLEFLDERLK